MANMTFKANLLPNSNLGYNLGSSDQKWNVYGDLKGNADSATTLTSSAGSSTVPIYFSSGKPVQCSTTLGVSITGTAVFTGKGSHSAVISANEFNPPVGTITVLGNVSNTSMAHSNNANAEMIIKTHPTSGTNYYEARLGFSSNGSLYYMPVNSSSWKIISYSDHNHDGSYLNRFAWWKENESHSVNDLRGGCTFVYTTHSAPVTGTLVSFDCSTNTNYTLQLMGKYNGEAIYYRNRNGDNGTWNAWRQLVHNSGTWGINITGSAGSVAWGNVTGKPSTFTPSSHTHNYAGSSSAGGAANSAIYASSYLANRASVSGNSHAAALQSYFNSYKSSEPRNALVAHYSSAYGNGSMCFGYFLNGYDSTPYGGFFVAHYNTAYYVGIQNGSYSQRKIWTQGDSVTGAVWNDYAECRTATSTEPGYVWVEKGDDTLIKSTKRLQPFAGVSSDTWGFSEGETETAKTHIAVAGRVLVYPYRDRNKYKPGQCVCTAPNGTVDIMHWWEEILFPSRIVGTVSCVPEYEEWGGGEAADRDPVKVDGRIWIKVR